MFDLELLMEFSTVAARLILAFKLRMWVLLEPEDPPIELWFRNGMPLAEVFNRAVPMF